MKILFVCFPYSIHAARWVSLLNDTNWNRHVFPSQIHNGIHERFLDATYWPIPGLPLPYHASTLRLGHPPGNLTSIGDRDTLVGYLAAVIDQEHFDFIHSMEFQHAGYLVLDALERIRGPAPKWIATNYGADIMLFGKQAEHQAKIRRLLSRCNYYCAECHRDVLLAREFGFTGQPLLIVPSGGGLDLSEVDRLRQPGKTSTRRTIAIKGYQHFAGRALTALKAIEICHDHLSGAELKIFTPYREVEAEAERLKQLHGLRISCLPEIVPHEEILKLHGSARISIGISIADGISTSLLEAMAMGSFPIQTSTACASEWIEDGKSGFIVEPDDPETIADRIVRAVTDDELVDRAAELNLQKIRQHGNSDVVRRLVQSAYLRVVQS